MTYLSVGDAHEGIAIYRTVLASAVDSLQECWHDILVHVIAWMLHGIVAPWLDILFRFVVEVWIGDVWTVDDQTGIAVDATQLRIVLAFRLQASSTSGKYLREDDTATDIDERSVFGWYLVVFVGKDILIFLFIFISHVGNIATAIYAAQYHGTVYQAEVVLISDVSSIEVNFRFRDACHIREVNPSALVLVID